MKKLTVLALTLTMASLATAQPPARGKAQATVGGKAVSIDYGQAKLGTRTLDELMKALPKDGVWRASATARTARAGCRSSASVCGSGWAR